MMLRLAIALTCANFAVAQCPQFTPTFHGGGFDDQVEELKRFDDGAGLKLYAGGRFNGAGAVAAAHVAVWDGEQWSALGAGLDGAVNALEVHDDGSGPKLYAGGAFKASGATSATRVARWSGASWSALGAGLTGGPVLALQSFDDGSGSALYAGGGFTSSGATSTSRVARWDGASWSQVGGGLSGTVRAFAVHDDGSGPSLFAARDGGARVVRWDGANWAGVGAALGADAILRAMVSYDAGPGQRWLVVGGQRLLGVDSGVAVWDGSNWTSLLTVDGAHSVHDLIVRQEGADLALYACGGMFAGFVQRWTPAAGWTRLVQDLSNGVPLALAFHNDGTGGGEQLYTAGQFTWLQPINGPWLDAQRIARFGAGTWSQVMAPAAMSLTPPIAPSFQVGYFDDPEVVSLARWLDPRDGRAKLAVSGRGFALSSGSHPFGLALWDGVAWSTLPSSPISGAFIDAVSAWFDPSVGVEVLVVSADLPNSVWRFDGGSWSQLGTNGPTRVRAFASYRAPGAASAELYAAPSNPSSPLTWRVTRWDGTTWHDVPGLVTNVAELLVFDPPGPLGEELYALGAQPSPAHRWDGTQWTALPTSGLPAGVSFLSGAVFDDGSGPELFAGGLDALYRFDGAAWTSYPLTAEYDGWELEVFDDGSGPALYTGGGQRFRNGQMETFAAAGPASPVGEPFDLEAFEDESGGSRALFIGGHFDFVGIPSRGIARWSNPCGALRSYCTAKVNSLGCTPSIGWSGEPSVALVGTTPFVITAANVLNQRPGLLYYGVFGASATPFQGGVQCVNAPVRRTPLRSSGGNTGGNDCSGLYAIDFSSWIDGTSDPLLSIGTTVRAQWWSRDPASASGTGLSNALELEVRP